MSLHSDTLFGF